MANEVKYKDQKWGEDTPIAGEQLSANGSYTGHKNGTPTQGAGEDEANADSYVVAHETVRYGTITQDADPEANMPELAEEEGGDEGDG